MSKKIKKISLRTRGGKRVGDIYYTDREKVGVIGNRDVYEFKRNTIHVADIAGEVRGNYIII